jgi:lipoyl(octanoyl) transferase
VIKVKINHFNTQTHTLIWHAMRDRQSMQQDDLPDCIWFGEHPAIYTLGQAADHKHLHTPNPTIPVTRTDRGGQITYHGPGQLMFYTLFNLKRIGWGIRRLVIELEQTLIEYLAQHHIHAQGKRDAPGVYINDEKVAAIGLRVKHGCTYHGMAINVNMDLSPFAAINPCGHQNLAITQLADHQHQVSTLALGTSLSAILANKLGSKAVLQPWVKPQIT